MPTEIFIDPNVRVRGGQTYSAFRHVRGDTPRVGEEVFVREPESNLVGKATVTDIGERDHLIYLRVDWATLAPEEILTPDQLMSHIAAAGSYLLTPEPTPAGDHTQASPTRSYAEPLRTA
ncbi:MAG: hypothetical protein ACLP4W_09870 [Mycobacterium sp.]|uniref:hypothetical protein n=1 Tax=Mycobacterium sp. TaxID=1785 RepID=UPI003F9EA25D